MPDTTMKNKHFAVTGGAMGIGAEVVARLRGAGARVTVFDIAEPGADIDRYVPIDLADGGSIDAALAQAENYDGLANIAGLPPRKNNMKPVLAVNFIGLRHFCRGLYDKLGGNSSIVNLSSLAGARWRQNIDQVKRLIALDDDTDLDAFIAGESLDTIRAYDLSKEAVTAWTMGQCESLIGLGLRMNSISPGAVQTAIFDDFIAAFGERATRNIERVGRPSTPGEVADAVLFLLSPQSAWIKGIDITVDGGIAACNQTDMLGL